MKSDKYYIFCMCIIKLLKTFTTNSVIKIMKENKIVTGDPTKFILILIGQKMLMRI